MKLSSKTLSIIAGTLSVASTGTGIACQRYASDLELGLRGERLTRAATFVMATQSMKPGEPSSYLIENRFTPAFHEAYTVLSRGNNLDSLHQRSALTIRTADTKTKNDAHDLLLYISTRLKLEEVSIDLLMLGFGFGLSGAIATLYGRSQRTS